MNDLLVALAVILGGGVLALVLSPRPRLASAAGAAGAVLGSALGLAAALRALDAPEERLAFAWSVPGGALLVGTDPLTAFFLVPLFVLGGLAAVYGFGYLDGKRAAAQWFAYDVLLASMLSVLVARHALALLVAWEVMALASYVLVSWEHERAEVRRAGWVYLLATHTATALLVVMFLLLARPSGSLAFDAFFGSRSESAAAAIFALAIVGFGTKAGFVPLHVWLPEAHAAAPSHVSALMSGVVIKMGLYGVLRAMTFLGAPRPWWGPTLAALGVASAAFGIALASYQRDMKRVLAYSSVENVGFIAIGLGVGLWGAASGAPAVASLGITGALLHVWNHTLMKGAMFLGAGSVLHATGTKDLEKMGGLLRRMPHTGAAMVLAAIAIGALPPMNGFVSEWLIYLGLVDAGLARPGTTGLVALLVVGVVALIGTLTAFTFVRLVGIGLLGEARSEEARRAHESSPWMTAPIAVLVAACALVAIAPGRVVRLFARTASAVAGGPLTAPAAPLETLGAVNLALFAAIAVAGLVLARAAIRATRGPTWDCGYAARSPRVQYTAHSFSQLLTLRMLPRRLRAKVTRAIPEDILPQRARFATDTSDPITRGVYEPLLERTGRRFADLRWLQQGQLHLYLLYILVVVVLALAWTSVRAYVWS